MSNECDYTKLTIVRSNHEISTITASSIFETDDNCRIGHIYDYNDTLYFYCKNMKMNKKKVVKFNTQTQIIEWTRDLPEDMYDLSYSALSNYVQLDT